MLTCGTPNRDKSVSKTVVAVEYGPQLVSGGAVFFAFKLGVSDLYRSVSDGPLADFLP